VTVLVAYASKYGTTEEIAASIGRELRLQHLHVDVRCVDEVDDLDGYDAVVLGSAVYLGRWLSSARHFVKRHGAELAARPTWLFSSGPIGNPPRPQGDVAVEIAEIVEATGAREHRVFPGKLDLSRLNRCEWAIVFALRIKQGDYQDEDAVSTWARRIAAELGRQPSRSPSLRA
jgi:menaquinone-dependent protoporphyrinogen oxidase